jgi:hypothetical protein
MTTKPSLAHSFVVLAVCAGLGVSCSRNECPQVGTTETTAGAFRSWQQVTRNWPVDSKSAVLEMTDKYGAPDEVTLSQLVWNQRGPWKKSIVSRDPIHHEWPSPHEDVLEQVIDYRVPPEKLSDIGRFDGSVMVERTKGEVSARCGGESANFLALNLTRDLVDGTRSVDDARHFYEVTMKAYKAGQKSEYMTSLRFAPTPYAAADPDRAAP